MTKAELGAYVLASLFGLACISRGQSDTQPANAVTTPPTASDPGGEPLTATPTEVPSLNDDAPDNSEAPSEFADEVTALAPACTAWTDLPSLIIERDTRIDADCLEFPEGTTYEVKNGATLLIIASRGFKVGKNVTIHAKGKQGDRGNRAASKHKKVGFQGFNGNCRCVNNDHFPELRGGRGHDGGRGGDVLFLVRNATVATGFKVIVDGGEPGKEGEGGTVGCYDTDGSGRESASNVCPGGGEGKRGDIGSVNIWPAGNGSDIALQALKAAVKTPDGVKNATRADPVGVFRRKRTELRNMAMTKNFALLP